MKKSQALLSYGKLRFHTIINAPRGCALGARVDGCRGNRASARECAKAHSFLLYRKEEIDLKVHASSYRIPEPCTGENRDQRDYNNAADGADHRRPGQPQRKEKIPADKQLDTGAQQRSFREKIKRFH